MIPCHVLLLVTTSALVVIYFLHFPAQWQWFQGGAIKLYDAIRARFSKKGQ